jgi:hypothetical protein
MLSEIRPDVAWPEKLQEVMDRGLSRDADERYQSAAQFGRDFAEAVSGMPSVAASEGATMVIGAASVAASAAKTKPVPATRVAGRDDAKSPAKSAPAAPAAVAKKSSMIPMAVGGVAVVIAGYFGFTALKGDGVPDPAVVDSSAVVSAPDTQPAAPAANSGTGNVTPPPIPTGGGTTTMSQPMNPGTGAARPEKQPAAATNVPAPSANAGATIASWKTRLESIELATDSLAGARVGRSALREVEPLMPTLTGIQLDDAMYVTMLSYVAIGNDSEVCRTARVVRASRNLTAEQRGLGANLFDSRECR